MVYTGKEGGAASAPGQAAHTADAHLAAEPVPNTPGSR